MASKLIRQLIGEASHGRWTGSNTFQGTELLGKIIDLMKMHGVPMESPYDFENWIADNASSHDQLFATHRFDAILGEAATLGHARAGEEPAFSSNIPSGDSQINAHTANKDAEELPHDNEETRELKIADNILKACHGMARTPAVEDIIRQAEELKRIHGVQ